VNPINWTKIKYIKERIIDFANEVNYPFCTNIYARTTDWYLKYEKGLA